MSLQESVRQLISETYGMQDAKQYVREIAVEEGVTEEEVLAEINRQTTPKDFSLNSKIEDAALERLEARLENLIGQDLKVQWKVLSPEAKIPQRAYESAGYDLFPAQSGVIKPGERVNINLGIASAFTPGWAAIIDDRGSTGNKGVSHLAGVIDADYRGEWILIMLNTGKEPVEYSPKKAFAQVLFVRVGVAKEIIVDELPETIRNTKKLGSSD